MFIAWACVFHSGGKTEGLTQTLVCMSFGAAAIVLAALILLKGLATIGSIVLGAVFGRLCETLGGKLTQAA